MMSSKQLVGVAFLAAAVLAVPAPAQAQPGQAALSTVGAAGTYTFVWTRVAGSTWYYLWVNDSAGVPRHQVWYTAEQTRCAAAESTCQITVDLHGSSQLGLGTWWIQTWNTGGFGPWSGAGTFYLRPPAAPMVVDNNNKYVGVLQDRGVVLVNYAGAPAEVAIYKLGLQTISLITIYYTTPSCDGTKYATATFPDQINFTGSLTWGWLTRGAPQDTAISRQQTHSGGVYGSCTIVDFISTVQPLTLFDGTAQFGSLVTPFKVIQQ